MDNGRKLPYFENANYSKCQNGKKWKEQFFLYLKIPHKIPHILMFKQNFCSPQVKRS